MADDRTVHATFLLPRQDNNKEELRILSDRIRILEGKWDEDHKLLVSIHSLLTNLSGSMSRSSFSGQLPIYANSLAADVRNSVEKDSTSNRPLPSRNTSNSTIVNSSMLPGSPNIGSGVGPVRKRRRLLKPTIPPGFSFGNQTTPSVHFAPSEDRSPTLAVEGDEPTRSPKIPSLLSAEDGSKLAGFSFRTSAAQIAARKSSRENSLFVRQGSETIDSEDEVYPKAPEVPRSKSKSSQDNNRSARQGSETTDAEDEIQPRAPDIPRSNPKAHLSSDTDEDPPTTTSVSLESPMDPPGRHSWSTQTPVFKEPRSRFPDVSPNDVSPHETRSTPGRVTGYTVGLPVTSQSSPRRIFGLPVSSQTSSQLIGDIRSRSKRVITKPKQAEGMRGWSDVDPSLLNQRQTTKSQSRK